MSEHEKNDLFIHINRINTRTLVQVWAIIAWCAGALFWGGYAYNRFVTMDKHLESIDTKMDRLAEMDTIRARQADHAKRLETVEQELFQLLQQQKFQR